MTNNETLFCDDNDDDDDDDGGHGWGDDIKLDESSFNANMAHIISKLPTTWHKQFRFFNFGAISIITTFCGANLRITGVFCIYLPHFRYTCLQGVPIIIVRLNAAKTFAINLPRKKGIVNRKFTHLLRLS